MSLKARLRPAAAVLVTVAAGGLGVLSSSPASAAPCPGSTGVTVVVESNRLGAGSSQSCVTDGSGHTADRLLKDAGHSLTYVQRFPGFVCQIDGLPTDDPCVNTPPADAYWGLWWSDGKTGKWTYSSLGAGSLSVPAGGYVAMVWDGSSGDVRPSAVPAVHPAPTPSPTPSPTKKPSPTPTSTPSPTPTSSPSAATSAAATGTPTARPSPTKTPKPSRTPSPTEETTSAAPPSESPSDQQSEAGGPLEPPAGSGGDDGGGLPGWMPPALVVVLLGAAGGVAVIRRRT